MCFYVDDPRTMPPAKGLQSPQLVEHIGYELFPAQAHVPPPEAHEVRVRHVCPYCHAGGARRSDGAVHRARVAGVETASNTCARHVAEQFGIGAQAVGAKALTHVTIEVDLR